MKHLKEFSRFAKVYADYNIIQKQVASELLQRLNRPFKRVIDLGCGSGTVYKAIDWELESFVGVDLSLPMLENHPKDDRVHLWHESFDSPALFSKLKKQEYDLLISSGSLQWSEDLEALFKHLQETQKTVALTLFTSNTFKRLHEEAQTHSPLYDKSFLQELAQKYFNADVTFKEYVLKFDSKKELFRYLKRSGVSGGNNQLDYKQTKRLMNEYPEEFLEFEVAFIVKESV